MDIKKNMTNKEIAHLLRAIAAAYEIKDEKKNLFRIRAYQRAADAVEHLSSEAKDLWDDKKLQEVGGIGESIAEHLGEIFKTGRSKHFEKVTKGISPATFELMKVSGIGPKTAHKLTNKLNIKKTDTAFKKLSKAANKGKIAKLEGMGEDSQQSILEALEEAERKKGKDRLLLSYAANIAGQIVSYMKKNKKVASVDALGSLRRKAATVGDIDISVASDDPKAVIEHFVAYPKAKKTLERGEKDASILLPGEIQVDIKIGDPDTYGALLQHFTGSKHHNIALREHALKKRLSLSEYGIKKAKKRIKTETEKDFYNKLGMDYIPPELREATGEIEAALKGKLPNLIELKNVKGDLQIHSDFDIETSHDLGESSMKDIVKKAGQLGYEYIAFTEHNPSQKGHRQKDFLDILKRKKEAIEKINFSIVKGKKTSVKKVFNSLEIDILPDGSLPVPEKALELLDFFLIAIHSSFNQSRKKMTKRILSAFEHPKAKIFAHPTARKINHREGVEIEWPKVFEFCKKHSKWLEINADPMRLDLPDMKVKDAIEAGVKLTLGTDSHHKDALDNMEYGVFVARRGWAEKSDIINTLSYGKLRKLL